MTPTTVGLSMFGAMLALMALRVPIAAAMFVPGAIGYAMQASPDALLNHLKGLSYARLAVHDLLQERVDFLSIQLAAFTPSGRFGCLLQVHPPRASRTAK